MFIGFTAITKSERSDMSPSVSITCKGTSINLNSSESAEGGLYAIRKLLMSACLKDVIS